MSDDKISDLLDLSKAMLNHAQNDDWENVEEVEQKRQTVLQDFFADIQQHDATNLQSTIEKLLQYEAQIITIAQDQKEETKEALQKCLKAKQAKQLYTK